MSLRGVWQLKKFAIHFCEVSKSSEGVKHFVQKGELFKFAELHPHIHFVCHLRKSKHPYVQGEFMNGRV
jgi:uncharacterized protein YlbG (UPF0298 family)